MFDKHVIRSFIAVEIPQEIKCDIFHLQAEMKLNKYSFVKWVSSEGIHITLKFLGNIISEKAEEITNVVRNASKETSPFSIEIGELGTFPNVNKVRILWVGISGEIEKLVALQQNIDNSLTTLGFPKEKRSFSPHITLARVRENASLQNQQDFGKLISRTQFEIKRKVNINSVSLMRSQLLPTGAVYDRLAEIELGKI